MGKTVNSPGSLSKLRPRKPELGGDHLWTKTRVADRILQVPGECPYLETVLLGTNSWLTHKERLELLPFVGQYENQKGQTYSKRKFVIADFAARKIAPLMYEQAGFFKEASKCRTMSPVTVTNDIAAAKAACTEFFNDLPLPVKMTESSTIRGGG